MKVERKNLHGNIHGNIIDFKNYYVGCPAGPIFLSSPKILKFRKLSKESPKYYARNKYYRMCEDSSRFNSLNEERNNESIKENFRKNLNSYETPEDINNFINLHDPNHLTNGAKEQAQNIQKSKERTHSKVLSLKLPGMSGNMISDDEINEETVDYVA